MSKNGHLPAAPAEPAPPPPASPVVKDMPTRLGSLTARERQWIWRGFVPRGVVTVLTGPQGMGKTALLSHVAARLTQPAEDPIRDFDRADHVLWFSTEDDPRAMLWPRLTAAQVDINRVLVPDYDAEGRQFRKTQIPTHAEAVGDLAWRCRAGLVVFDPLTSFLAPGISPNDPLQVRQVMDALSLAAAQHDLAIVVSLHPRKGRSGHPLDWVSGSSAWTQAARQVLLVDRHPDLAGENFLSVLKPCSAVRVKPWRFGLPLVDGSPVFTLIAECDISAEELGELGDLGESLERSDALEWLANELQEERETRSLFLKWQAQGYGRALWWRCRRKLGVKVTRRGSQLDQTTYLYIPPAAP